MGEGKKRKARGKSRSGLQVDEGEMLFHGNVYPGQGSAARLGESGGSVCGPWSGMTQGRRNITEEGRGLRLREPLRLSCPEPWIAGKRSWVIQACMCGIAHSPSSRILILLGLT